MKSSDVPSRKVPNARKDYLQTHVVILEEFAE